MHNNNKQFFDVRQEIQGIMNSYRICKFNLSKDYDLFNKSVKDLRKCRVFVDSIDFIFTGIGKENAKLIQDITLRHTPIWELGYSVSSFYAKFRNAANEFLKYFE